MILFYSRLFDLSLWAIVALCFLPAAVRSFSKRIRPCDEYRAALFFTALWVVGNYMIRLAGETSMYVLTGLNAVAAALAVYLLILVRQGLVQNHGKRG
jgi:hypothetical protein